MAGTYELEAIAASMCSGKVLTNTLPPKGFPPNPRKNGGKDAAHRTEPLCSAPRCQDARGMFDAIGRAWWENRMQALQLSSKTSLRLFVDARLHNKAPARSGLQVEGLKGYTPLSLAPKIS
eukprot:CAMPEP_0183820204 /NCGR_PEP_ID=MMETSP0803_2-20130417/64523_1 /TAXON_ID=195967 /ORGANISM="Crustomastix stigmata, Strain CCMP3273" /LENGTH=120 /DNA_ID=CAMNT_0026065097 /DNA_START=1041 /DNA_END=1404 /DNA_ORIENTATION=+